MDHPADRILVLNAGSSSLKLGLFDAAETRLTEAEVAWTVDVHEVDGHRRALRQLLAGVDLGGIAAVGHRVVHGGTRFAAPVVVDDAVRAGIAELATLAPLHIPAALDAIEAVEEALPGVPQVACFDTAFHRRMPRLAQLYALPLRLTEAGVIRYGFHGLSYESIVDQLRVAGDPAAGGRLVIAHLGNGASMAAVRDGRGVDTTMGFTPTGGLMMGTRSGDLDPGVLLHLLQIERMAPAAIGALVNRESGLLGVSGISADMRDLLGQEAADPRAAEAVALFCYQAKKFLGALVAVLGGVDTVVFTGGIGEHAAPVRERICAGLDGFGLRIDPTRNRKPAAIISPDGAAVTVRVMHTDEDLMIARQTATLVR